MVSEKESTFLGMKSTLSNGNLNKSTFLVVGSSLVVPWFVLGSSLVFYTGEIRTVQGKEILRKVLFFNYRSVGVLSVISRSSVGGIRQGIRGGKETAILRKSLFLYLQNLILLHVTRVPFAHLISKQRGIQNTCYSPL